ncbi:2223_t:CDS:2 [Entrophospora sp. SA101]|nr:2223_t:CDS:2 [Entrophospora sp. SA101]
MLNDGDGKTNVTVGTDGDTYEITSDLVTISRQTISEHVREYTPNVIEPSFGIGRILYSLIEHVFWTREGDEQRSVLSFPPRVAPFKCLLVPLSNNPVFSELVRDISNKLRKLGISIKVDDSSNSIGRRYSRNDELGTPFAITIDFQSVKDGTTTLRERDTTKQIRTETSDILQLLKGLLEEEKTWDEIVSRYEKLEKKWKISRWNKRFKKHVKEEKKEMKKWRKEFQNAVMNSQKEFYEKLGELKLEGKEVKKEEEDDTNTWLENLKQKKRVRKEKEEQTKALETWRLEYSGLPRYKPPETWWAKNRDKIMKEAMKKIPPKKQK